MKTIRFFLLVMTAVTLLSACVGINAIGVFDDSVPEAQLCNLEIRNSLAVILFNNQPVEWAPNLLQNRVTIALPPGEHTFTVRYFVTRGTGPHAQTVAETSNVAMRFIPGHSYRISRQNIWLVFFTITNIRIKDVTPRNQRQDSGFFN